jgi:hypothetical protein
LAGFELIDLSDAVLARAPEPWPTPRRTLDARHLATADYLRWQGEAIELAGSDGRLIAAAQAIVLPIAALRPARRGPPALIRRGAVPMFGPPQLESR